MTLSISFVQNVRMSMILALDLALKNTGYVVISQAGGVLEHATIKTPSSRRKKESKVAFDIRRLGFLADSVQKAVRDNAISDVVLEVPDWHQRLYRDRRKYARERGVQRALGMAYGVVLLALRGEGVGVHELGANEARRLLNVGSKKAMRAYLEPRYSEDTLEDWSHHEIDALGVGLAFLKKEG
jgi:Holliday junction resolvasome RuvABC endonuclease subunit